jgi:hypothetical protein
MEQLNYNIGQAESLTEFGQLLKHHILIFDRHGIHGKQV